MKINRVNFDKFFDYVPVASLVNNIIDLIQKKVFKNIEQKSPYQDHISNFKSKKRCGLYAIPFAKIVEKCAKKLFCKRPDHDPINTEEAPRNNIEDIRKKVCKAVLENCVGSESGDWQRTLCVRPDGSFTLNHFEDDITQLGRIHYTVEDFKISRIEITAGFENNPEIPEAFEDSDLIIEETPRNNPEDEEIRNKVRTAVSEFCVGTETLEPHTDRALLDRPDGSYTLNIHEGNTVLLGYIRYRITDSQISRIIITRGFKNNPEIREAFESFDY
jgi:hypothetical protein